MAAATAAADFASTDDALPSHHPSAPALDRALAHSGRVTLGAAAASAAPTAAALDEAGAEDAVRQAVAAVAATGAPPPSAPPPSVDVRLPPLRPKESARLALLATGADCLFAAPSATGGVLQWAGARGARPRPPTGADRAVAPRAEDGDASPAAELPPETPALGAVTATLWDGGRAVLWTGHAGGRVAGARVGSDGLLAAPDPRLTWTANRSGAVTALVLTAGGELWTGSSRGALRAWAPDVIAARAAATDDDAARPRALCRPGGVRAHGAGVMAAVASTGGGVVWTAGGRSLALWCARSGVFLAAHEPGVPPPPPPLRWWQWWRWRHRATILV